MVDTSQVPEERSSDEAGSDPGPPSWIEDFWPSECEWPDWDCTCEQFESERDRDNCRELAEDAQQNGDGGGRP